ncbi:hypothetical protein AB0K43_10900 [Kitasatospora sp. NPDC049258]|uniref:hypothetical protein n=1 Tax=Kitasatospora sp. NPDC049258 TaxID=3155394 RepID=UPI003435B63A
MSQATAPAPPPATAAPASAARSAPTRRDPAARVKLRPGTHFAPVSRGVHVSHVRRSFVLSGPPALYPLIDGQLGRLADGTSVDELVAAGGSESARPVLDHVVRTLLDQGVLLDLAALTVGEPDQDTAARYADVLAHLEDHSDDPYAVFARLRASTVEIHGSGPAVPGLVRGLAAYGIEQVGVTEPGSRGGSDPDLVVLVLAEDFAVRLAAPPPGRAVLPLLTLDDVAVVAGPGAPGSFAGLPAAVDRARAWAGLEPGAAAPPTMSAVLAGALAARACFEALTGLTTPLPETADGPAPVADQVTGRIAGTGADADAGTRTGTRTGTDAPEGLAPHHLTLVWGHTLESRRLPAPRLHTAPAAARWDGPDVAASLASTGAGRGSGPDALSVFRTAAALTARWTGPARLERDLDLPQIPVATASTRFLDGGGEFLGWGPTRAVAGVDALLTGLRDPVTLDALAHHAQPPADGRLVSCAGVTEQLWVLDGLLRLLAEQSPDPSGVIEIDWQDATHPEIQSLWGALLDHFDVPVALRTEPMPELGGSVATAVRTTDGAVLGRQWGPGTQSAVHAALVEACARVQTEVFRSPTRAAETGSWVLHALPAPRVAALASRAVELLDRPGRRVRAHRLLSDGVLDRLPLVCGLLEWR